MKGSHNGSNVGQDSLGDFSLNILLWLILPNMITGLIQKVYYTFRYKTNSVYRPNPGSTKYQRHHNRIYICVVGLYLAFCIVQIVYHLPANYYAEFGVAPTATDRELKAKFRKYSLQYHPDRNPSDEAQSKFMRLRKIYETLNNPINKEAYNKFGVMRHCLNCILFKDYLTQGLTEFLTFYGGTGVVLLVLNMIGQGQFARYWRFMSYLAMAALESLMLILPYDPVAWFLPSLTVAEKISFLHQSVIYVFIAISQFGPILFPNDHRDLRTALNKLESATQLQVTQAKKSLQTTFQPFLMDANMFSLLKRQMQKHSINMKLFEYDTDFRTIRSKAMMSSSSSSSSNK